MATMGKLFANRQEKFASEICRWPIKNNARGFPLFPVHLEIDQRRNKRSPRTMLTFWRLLCLQVAVLICFCCSLHWDDGIFRRYASQNFSKSQLRSFRTCGLLAYCIMSWASIIPMPSPLPRTSYPVPVPVHYLRKVDKRERGDYTSSNNCFRVHR